jgi:hypothetical protein
MVRAYKAERRRMSSILSSLKWYEMYFSAVQPTSDLGSLTVKVSRSHAIRNTLLVGLRSVRRKSMSSAKFETANPAGNVVIL